MQLRVLRVDEQRLEQWQKAVKEAMADNEDLLQADDQKIKNEHKKIELLTSRATSTYIDSTNLILLLHGQDLKSLQMKLEQHIFEEKLLELKIEKQKNALLREDVIRITGPAVVSTTSLTFNNGIGFAILMFSWVFSLYGIKLAFFRNFRK